MSDGICESRDDSSDWRRICWIIGEVEEAIKIVEPIIEIVGFGIVFRIIVGLSRSCG